MLLEDAFVIRDREALVELFEEGAVLAAGHPANEGRGGEAIGRLAASVWERHLAYVADPRRVLQARDVALVIAERGISVARRRSDGSWRYAISLLSLDPATTTKEER